MSIAFDARGDDAALCSGGQHCYHHRNTAGRNGAQMIRGIGITDAVAFLTFLVCWPGYHLAAGYVDTRRASLMSLVKAFRHRWFDRMAERESHIADATLLGNLLRGALFFASTTVFILGGLVALLGTAPKVAELIGQLPFAMASDPRLAELKAIALILVFVYAFFKFTWSAWQYNVLSILVGAMPPRGKAAGRIAALAGESYNNGVRAYYFSIPLMAWFASALAFLAATLVVTVVLYRREFYSPIMAALKSIRD
jgi:uncharacterized membrane protein